MRSSVLVALAVLGLFFFGMLSVASAGEQQVYLGDDLKIWDRENLAGGQGVLAGKFAFTRQDAKEDFVIKEIGWLTLPPGASVGMHSHTDNEDAFIIISGEGLFTDSGGIKTKVAEGDIAIARAGDSHALENTGQVPLVFICVIAQR